MEGRDVTQVEAFDHAKALAVEAALREMVGVIQAAHPDASLRVIADRLQNHERANKRREGAALAQALDALGEP